MRSEIKICILILTHRMKSEQAQMSGTSYKVLNQRLLLLAESWTADHHLAIKIRPGSDQLLAP